jgi:16S rRNA (guanine(966)-N(2))-methyltransferase RsmD
MKIISGTLRGRHLFMPKSDNVRPTSSKVREQVINICQHSLEDAIVLDLFAGSGAIGFECISRGAQKCCFVEKDRTVAATLRRNIDELNVQHSCQLYIGDALSALQRLRNHTPFTIVYIDPPYAQSDLVVQALLAIDTNLPLEDGAYVFIETERRFLPPLEGLTRLSLDSIRANGDTNLIVLRRLPSS